MLEISHKQLIEFGKIELRKFTLQKMETMHLEFPQWSNARSEDEKKFWLNEIFRFSEARYFSTLTSINEIIDFQIKFNLINLCNLNDELNSLISDQSKNEEDRIGIIRRFIIKNRIEASSGWQ